MKVLKLNKPGKQCIRFKSRELEKITLAEVYASDSMNKNPYFIVMIGGIPVRLFDRLSEARRRYDIKEEGYTVFTNQKTVDYYIDLIGANIK